MQQLVRRLWLQNGHYMCNAAWQRRPNSIAERQLCQCSLELVKPKHRLQRLFHSLQPGGASIVNGKSDLQISSPPSEKELNELRLLVNLLPQRLQPALLDRSDLSALVEVILDLGRPPVARFSGEDVRLSEDLVTRLDLQAAVEQVGSFGDDNRAGIDRTLHRVSCIRNRDGDIVGLTCRAGRAVYGCACLAADFAKEGKSILVLGKPGVGKTTAIRELGRYLAEDVQKRVIIVDTSNEIGGDGDVPHEGIGGCRRLQVKHVHQQHNVMIEAVENHMPEVVVIDEIGNQDESMAARTISQRGVQMVATAHGHKLENLLKNPALVELLGGIEIVTIGDESAKKRGLPRKSVRERAGPPSFDIAIELLERQEWLIYPNVAQAVDDLLKNKEPRAITRKMASKKMNPNVVSTVTSSKASVNKQTSDIDDRRPQMPGGEDIISVFPVGLDHDKILHARTLIGDEAQRMRLVFNLEFADVVLALRSQMKPKSLARDAARAANVPVYAVKSGTSRSMLKAIQTLLGVKSDNLEDSDDEEEDEEPKNHVVSMTAARNEAGALDEAREAVEQIVKETGNPVELLPRAPKVLEAQKAMLQTEFKDHPLEVLGTGLQSRLRIHPPADWQEKDGVQNMGFLSNAL